MTEPASSKKIVVFSPIPARQEYWMEILRAAGFDPLVGKRIGGHEVLESLSAFVEAGSENLPFPDQAYKAPVIPRRAADVISDFIRFVQKQKRGEAVLSIGNFYLDTHQNLWWHKDRPETTIRLTEKETALLCYLRSQNKPVSRDLLLKEIWGYVDGVETHTIETHIYRLRQKIETDPANPMVLKTMDDGGYVLLN